MKATISVTLQPFAVPNFVLAEPKTGSRSEGMVETPKYPLSDLDPETLDDLCDQFRRDVFKKAGKTPPPRVMMAP